MRVMITDAIDKTPVLLETDFISWAPDGDQEDGKDRSREDGCLCIMERDGGVEWEGRSRIFADGGYAKYMKEALTRGYLDLTEVEFQVVSDDDEEDWEE
ncbi:MAG: hypothetical protein IKO41_09000 [Lachnospiraceae bacterium]|nr:hypothetical protein [Lachnospiraceae bacterium]